MRVETVRSSMTGELDRNWRFSGSPEGAKASAILYSLITNAKANGWDAYQSLHGLFEGLITAGSDQDYEALLPINRKFL